MKRQLKLMLKIHSYRQWFSHSAFMFIWISEYMWWRLRFIFALSYLQKCSNYIIFEQFSSCNVSTWGHTPVATRPERADLWAFLEKKTLINLIYALFNLDIRCLSFPAKMDMRVNSGSRTTPTRRHISLTHIHKTNSAHPNPHHLKFIYWDQLLRVSFFCSWFHAEFADRRHI